MYNLEHVQKKIRERTLFWLHNFYQEKIPKDERPDLEVDIKRNQAIFKASPANFWQDYSAAFILE